MKKVIGLFFILIFASSCYSQDDSYEFSRKGETRITIRDSIAVEKAARIVADALKISIADSASYFYSRGYVDALLNHKLNLTDTVSLSNRVDIATDTTMNINLTELFEGDEIFLFQASKNIIISTVTSMKSHTTAYSETLFYIYVGSTLYDEGTAVLMGVGGDTYTAIYNNSYNYTGLSNTTITKGKYVWAVATEVSGDPNVIFNLNYH